ncbi:MAG: 2-amino-4-hydroxy-6-hydroxymethyldihydropteridine diphosphokinase [Acidobacteriota bacterium]
MNKTAVIALGSNQGDRRAHLDYAVRELSGLLADVRVSAFIESPPAAPARPTDPQYLNAVAVGSTPLAARALLDELLRVERLRGRTRPEVGAPRTLDLDLILLGSDIIHEQGLQVPHPRFRERRFVLEPLAEVAPDLVDPVTGLTTRELLERV